MGFVSGQNGHMEASSRRAGHRTKRRRAGGPVGEMIHHGHDRVFASSGIRNSSTTVRYKLLFCRQLQLRLNPLPEKN